MLAYRLRVPRFAFRWHYHPEFELTLIEKGKGVRLVGDSYEEFNEGDLVLIGPGLPHTWVSEGTSKTPSQAVVIQFSEDAIKGVISLPEFRKVQAMLGKAGRALIFKDLAVPSVKSQIQSLVKNKGAELITSLLQILNGLTRLSNHPLASPHYIPVKGSVSEKRINKVCQFLEKHATEKIALRQVSQLVHLSDSAFCKFFKRTTGKTFSDYLNDLRIGHAARLIQETDLRISDIAFDSGYESLTYFNRVFKRKRGIAPAQYREKLNPPA